MIDYQHFLANQLSQWKEANERYKALLRVEEKEISIDENVHYKLVFNPLRAKSTNAQTDARSIAERPCFLCKKNRPNVQKSITLFNKFEFLVNPFPMAKRHFTIVNKRHIPQKINETFVYFTALVNDNPALVFFYNGAKCGASAPDHMHFQALEKDFLPLQKTWKSRIAEKKSIKNREINLYKINFGYPLLIIESSKKQEVNIIFKRLYTQLSKNNEEPNWNLLSWKEDNNIIFAIILRKNHRPQCFYETGEKQCIVSPASIDLSGIITTVRREDYKRINAEHIQQILSEVCFSDDEFDKIWHKIAM